jgi:endonuclease/exonuclease/phosphatase family metal-dependent hydrolase
MKTVSLQVLTYNIHKGFNMGNTRFVLPQIREALQAADADLIFLQEIQGEHCYRELFVEGWPDTPQFEFLAQEIWPHWAYGKNAIYHAGHHGNAILSKYPFMFWENINVSKSRRSSRSMLHGVIKVPGALTETHVICIHFGLSPQERRRQLAILNHRIKTQIPEDASLIIAGDFNVWTSQAPREMQAQLGLKDVFIALKHHAARTFPVWLPILSVDRIFYRGATPVNCQCFHKSPWRKLSDHAALYATFSLQRH